MEADRVETNHAAFPRVDGTVAARMRQFLATAQDGTPAAAMSWASFLQLMHDVGFMDTFSATGSSVRFDPPTSDVSITFHKPHPDPTIHPVMLREFAKKVKKNYGWSEADFV
ncbi:hypothetical protein DFH09DRAFT_248564 [Mycena vulgaris]|nr:hypothetical protein DFH09DRAFT_248564 [Mycena vulgaris]